MDEWMDLLLQFLVDQQVNKLSTTKCRQLKLRLGNTFSSIQFSVLRPPSDRLSSSVSSLILISPQERVNWGPVHTMPVWVENGTTDLVPLWFCYGLTSVHTMPDRVPFSFRTVFRWFSCRHRVNRRPFRNDFVPFSNHIKRHRVNVVWDNR